MKQVFLRGAIALCGLVGLAGTAQAVIIIQPTGATATSEWAGLGRLAVDTINGSGLSSALSTGDAVPATFPTHNINPADMWQFNSGDSAPQSITFALDQAYNLTGIHIWNSNEPGFTFRGVEDVEVAYSTDGGVSFEPATLFEDLPEAPGSDTYEGFGLNYVANNANAVRFTVIDGIGTTILLGLSEVRFIGTVVPEPSSAILATASLGLMLARRRRKA